MNNLVQILAETNVGSSGAEIAGLIIGILGAIAIGIYVMPQCVKTLRSKDTASISLGMFILGAVGSFLFVLSAIINAINKKGSNLEMWLPTMLGNIFSCSASCIVIYLKVRNLKWAKKFSIKEDQIPNHFKEIKAALKKAKAEKKAKKAAEKEKQQIDDIKKDTPVTTETGNVVG